MGTLATIPDLPRDHRLYAGGVGKTVPMHILLGLPRKPLSDELPLSGDEQNVFDILGVEDSPDNRAAFRRSLRGHREME